MLEWLTMVVGNACLGMAILGVVWFRWPLYPSITLLLICAGVLNGASWALAQKKKARTEYAKKTGPAGTVLKGILSFALAAVLILFLFISWPVYGPALMAIIRALYSGFQSAKP